jgi:hypothetical protein
LGDEPRQTHLPFHLRGAEGLDTVQDGEEGAQAHCNEHEGAEGSPGWGAEAWEEHDDHCCCADGCDLRYCVISLPLLLVWIMWFLPDSWQHGYHRRSGSQECACSECRDPGKIRCDNKKTHHRPIQPNPLHIFRKTIVYGRYEAAPNEQNNSIVLLAKQHFHKPDTITHTPSNPTYSPSH